MGSAIFGNCAVGKTRMQMAPAMNMMIEITMATIGRLIKNLDMRFQLDRRMLGIGRPSLLDIRRIRLRIDLGAIFDFLYAFSDHAIASLQTVVDNPQETKLCADLNRHNGYFVIGAHDRDQVGALHVGHGTLRYQQRALLNGDYRTDHAEATGPEDIVRVGERNLDQNRASSQSDLTVNRPHFAYVRERGSVSQR